MDIKKLQIFACQLLTLEIAALEAWSCKYDEKDRATRNIKAVWIFNMNIILQFQNFDLSILLVF